MKNKLYILLLSVMALILSIMPCFSAYAYNADYMDYQKWINNKNTIQKSVNKTSSFGTLKGNVFYYIDNKDSCIYYCFDVSEPNIDSNSDVSIEFEVKNSTESFNFAVDENGMYQVSDGSNDVFDVYTSFTTDKRHNGIYVVALDIHNGSNENTVSAIFHTVARYRIDDIENISVIVPTTTKPQHTTTKKSTTKSSSKPKSNSSGRTTKAKTTKYYNPNPTYPSESKRAVDGEDEAVSSNTLEYTDTSSKATINKHSLWLIIPGIILATAGVMLIIFMLLSKNNKYKDDKDVEEKTEDDEFDF